MRIGGVIGPVPGEPNSVTASSGAQRPSVLGGPIPEEGSTRGINPIGGLLGGPMGAGVTGDRRGSGRSAPSYTEWEVPEGGPPVILPPPEPKDHDPGPGVIGIDR